MTKRSISFTEIQVIAEHHSVEVDIPDDIYFDDLKREAFIEEFQQSHELSHLDVFSNECIENYTQDWHAGKARIDRTIDIPCESSKSLINDEWYGIEPAFISKYCSGGLDVNLYRQDDGLLSITVYGVGEDNQTRHSHFIKCFEFDG